MPTKKFSISGGDIAKWVAILLTSISLLGGSFAWAGDRLDGIKKDLATNIADNYTKREDFARIEQRIINQEKQIENLDKKLDKILENIHNNR
jgi:hypothetical protein